MQVSVTARHVRVTTLLKEHAEERARRLERYFSPLHKVQVVLEGEGDHRFRVEIIVSIARGRARVCQSVNDTGMAAVDAAAAKMEQQLRRLKEKIRDRHGRVHGRIGQTMLQASRDLAD